MRGRVPVGSRVRRGWDAGDQRLEYEGTVTSQYGDHENVVQTDGEYFPNDYYPNDEALFDPKTGTAERHGRDGRLIHDEKPPMEHRQPSQGREIKEPGQRQQGPEPLYEMQDYVPKQQKSLYEIFHNQQKQIQLLQRQMKMLMKTMDPVGPEKEDDPSYGYEEEDSNYKHPIPDHRNPNYYGVLDNMMDTGGAKWDAYNNNQIDLED